MTGVAFFTAGSLLCGIAPDNATLIAGRTLTGLGAAFEMPTSLAILSDAYSDTAQRTRAIGVWASCNGLAWVVEPTMGGVIVGYIGWRWIFLVAVPVGLLASVPCLRWVPKSRGQNGRRIDATGSTLSTIGCLAAAVGSFACFFIVELSPLQELINMFKCEAQGIQLGWARNHSSTTRNVMPGQVQLGGAAG
jgi:DHA2 family methylenomycin A resistance protein-like MFS transporter